MAFVDNILKQIGTLLIRRSPKNSLSNQSIKNTLDQDVTDYVNQALF
jgi:lambda repressor-like predicted transcriptional regulator